MKTPEEFFGKQALKRYKYAVSLAEKINSFKDQGYIVFDNEFKPIEKIEIVRGFDEDSWDILNIPINNNIKCGIIGIEYWDNGSPWLPPIKEIKKIFKDFTCIHPKDVISIV